MIKLQFETILFWLIFTGIGGGVITYLFTKYQSVRNIIKHVTDFGR
ncbi:hypothetical protein [Companilactobacillus mishanensis]|nr:hypothetical protein [Companilactobacillus mishanensis]